MGNVKVVSSGGGNASVQTSATGATYVDLTAVRANRVHIFNDTGTIIEVRQGGSGIAVPINDGISFTFSGIANAGALALRRADTSNTQVTVKYRWEN